MLSSVPKDEHAENVSKFGSIWVKNLDWSGLAKIRSGRNVCQRVTDGMDNDRVSEAAVFLADSQIVRHGAFWHGGRDDIHEIVNPNDLTRDALIYCKWVLVSAVLTIETRGNSHCVVWMRECSDSLDK